MNTQINLANSTSGVNGSGTSGAAASLPSGTCRHTHSPVTHSSRDKLISVLLSPTANNAVVSGTKIVLARPAISVTVSVARRRSSAATCCPRTVNTAS
ncbi:hypothetical protein [Deinococcus ruber]|uniref:hypothetical protein n=1 Tax=Deinococcus ruber TaxID=1848197 RepID=UPI0016689FE6|nr:hypothetical protein [Deinococcus ruber]